MAYLATFATAGHYCLSKSWKGKKCESVVVVCRDKRREMWGKVRDDARLYMAAVVAVCNFRKRFVDL